MRWRLYRGGDQWRQGTVRRRISRRAISNGRKIFLGRESSCDWSSQICLLLGRRRTSRVTASRREVGRKYKLPPLWSLNTFSTLVVLKHFFDPCDPCDPCAFLAFRGGACCRNEIGLCFWILFKSQTSMRLTLPGSQAKLDAAGGMTSSSSARGCKEDKEVRRVLSLSPFLVGDWTGW